VCPEGVPHLGMEPEFVDCEIDRAPGLLVASALLPFEPREAPIAIGRPLLARSPLPADARSGSIAMETNPTSPATATMYCLLYMLQIPSI
jgi:hypothetical protein